MNVYPLESIDIEEAKEKQFKIVDIITKHFRGSEILTRGDLGVIKGINKPSFTLKAENIISEFFNAEKSVLVRGAGTAAIKWGLYGLLKDKNRRNINGGISTMMDLKKLGLFVGGALFGSAGIKVLSSDDAKKLYTQTTAAVLRAKECVMTAATTLKENTDDILADAKEINEQRAAAKEMVIDDAPAEAEAEPAEASAEVADLA